MNLLYLGVGFLVLGVVWVIYAVRTLRAWRRACVGRYEMD